MPIKILLNGEEFSFESEMTVEALLLQQGLETRSIAVAVNECFVPGHAYATTPLTEGAHIEIIAPMQGG